jgi:hypothetical protein
MYGSCEEIYCEPCHEEFGFLKVFDERFICFSVLIVGRMSVERVVERDALAAETTSVLLAV